jgi:hypothetical protein
MNLLYEPSDPHLYETLLHIVRHAVEGPYSNTRVQAGTITLSCTQNVLKSQSVTFAKPYAKGTVPVLLLFVNPTTTSSVVTPSYASLTNTGFTAQVYSNTTQSVTVNYLAIGQVGGA